MIDEAFPNGFRSPVFTCLKLNNYSGIFRKYLIPYIPRSAFPLAYSKHGIPNQVFTCQFPFEFFNGMNIWCKCIKCQMKGMSHFSKCGWLNSNGGQNALQVQTLHLRVLLLHKPQWAVKSLCSWDHQKSVGPRCRCEREKTRFNRDWAEIVIKRQTEVRIPRSQAEGRSKSRVDENTNQSLNQEVRDTYNQ